MQSHLGSSYARAACALAVLACLILGCSGSGELDAGPAAVDAALSDASSEDAGCTGDEACDDGLFCNGAESCVDGACVAGAAPACDDGIECTTDRCSEAARACENLGPDADGDGVTDIACIGADGLPLGQDCDDADPDRYPDNPEVCDDGHDEDCDASTVGSVDEDSDLHVASRCCNRVDGVTTCGTDCDDARGNVHPGAPELCDDRDNNCDTMVDEGLAVLTFGIDCDGDGFGVAADPPAMDCVMPTTPAACADGAGAWVEDTSDCDDSSAARNPGLIEVCDGLDNNCDAEGLVDEGLIFTDYYPDCDGDTYGDELASAFSACETPGTPPACAGGSWVRRRTDCDDTRAAVNPGSVEICNAIDDECDGLVDDITDGVVVCEQGETRSCGGGTETCLMCVRWGSCF